MRLIPLFAACIVAVAADAESVPQLSRISGGLVTTVERYPSMVSVLSNRFSNVFALNCGGSIISNRIVLTAAHCVASRQHNLIASRLRIRVGSSFHNRGGRLHNVALINIHPNYNVYSLDSDVVILRVQNAFVYNNAVRAIPIAPANNFIPDNAALTEVGWGQLFHGGAFSEQLREAQVWSVNWNQCFNLYQELGLTISPNMMCSGVFNVGRGSCAGDEGGPVFHMNNNRQLYLAGIISWGQPCGNLRYPRVSVPLSRFSQWIINNQ